MALVELAGFANKLKRDLFQQIEESRGLGEECVKGDGNFFLLWIERRCCSGDLSYP
jgi:hypothetical protein